MKIITTMATGRVGGIAVLLAETGYTQHQ